MRAGELERSAIELETAGCPLCGDRLGRRVRRAHSWLDTTPGEYDVHRCGNCGLWVTSPRPTAETLGLVYPSGYHRKRVSDGYFPAATKGRLLDVGCGVGDAMALSRLDGWECVGVEISDEAAAVARDRGFEVHVGDAVRMDYPTGFDRVRCWHTLEHVAEPHLLMQRLAEAVTAEGEVEIVVPNRRSLTAKLFRRYWYHLDVPRHLHHFRPTDIRALAERAGLRVKSVRHTAHPSGLLGSFDALWMAKRGRDPKLRSNARLRSMIRAVTWPVAKLRLADVVEYRLARRT